MKFLNVEKEEGGTGCQAGAGQPSPFSSGSSNHRQSSSWSSRGICWLWHRHREHLPERSQNRRIQRQRACSVPRWRSGGHHCRPGRHPCHPTWPGQRRASHRRSCSCSVWCDIGHWWWWAHQPPAGSCWLSRPPWSDPSRQRWPGRAEEEEEEREKS